MSEGTQSKEQLTEALLVQLEEVKQLRECEKEHSREATYYGNKRREAQKKLQATKALLDELTQKELKDL